MRHPIVGAFALFLIVIAACSRPTTPPPVQSDEDKTVAWLNDVVGPIRYCAKTHRCSEDTLGKLADKAMNFGDDHFESCGQVRIALKLIPTEHWSAKQKRDYESCGPAAFLQQ